MKPVIRMPCLGPLFCPRDSEASPSNSETGAPNPSFWSAEWGVRGSTPGTIPGTSHSPKFDIWPTGFNITGIRCPGSKEFSSGQGRQGSDKPDFPKVIVSGGWEPWLMMGASFSGCALLPGIPVHEHLSLTIWRIFANIPLYKPFFLQKKRVEYCFESTVSEKRTHWASLSFGANSVSSAKHSVSSLCHTKSRPRGTHWVLSQELGESKKTHWPRCLKPYSPKTVFRAQPKRAYSSRGCSRNLLGSPFSEPLLLVAQALYPPIAL